MLHIEEREKRMRHIVEKEMCSINKGNKIKKQHTQKVQTKWEIHFNPFHFLFLSFYYANKYICYMDLFHMHAIHIYTPKREMLETKS